MALGSERGWASDNEFTPIEVPFCERCGSYDHEADWCDAAEENPCTEAWCDDCGDPHVAGGPDCTETDEEDF